MSRSMSALVEHIQINQHLLEQRAQALGVPLPTFDDDSIALYGDQQAAAARKAIQHASLELHDLSKGPMGILTQPAHNHHAIIHVLAKYDIAGTIPVVGNEGLDFNQIAAKCSLDATITKRFVKAAISCHIFKEQPEGIVRHNAASRYLATSPEMRQWILMVLEELWPAATKVAKAIEVFSQSEAQEPNKAAYGLAHHTDKGCFGFMATQPERFKRFADSMTWFSSAPGLEASHLADTYPWNELKTGKIVDVGGSFGAVSMAVAKKYPDLHFIVQDSPEIIERAKVQLASKADNISFQAHDFFSEQPIKDAKVYLLRQILHDWSDVYASRIIRALLPALKAGGGALLVMEQILPGFGNVDSATEQAIRFFDLAMLELANGRERDMGDWKDLFEGVDSRLRITRAFRPTASRMSVIEARIVTE